MKNYHENINFLRENTRIPNSRFYIYDENPGREIFEEAFQFFQSNLEKNYFYGIEPAYFYFINDNDIKAIATPPSGLNHK